MFNFIDPEVQRSFRQDSVGFVSRSAGGFTSCPPYVIASVAQRRIVDRAELVLPEDCDDGLLSRIRNLTGFVDQDVRVSPLHAYDLAQIGRQILVLNEQGRVQPPLSDYEKQSIGHLVMLVDQMPAE